MDEDERNYYNQLHETLRAYQKELWGIPILFFGLEGFIFLKVINDPQLLAWEFFILLVNLFALIMIHIYFEKIYDRSSKLQKKIDEYDSYFMGKYEPKPERLPMYRGEYNLFSVISSSSLNSATAWFRVIVLFFIGLSLFLLVCRAS